MRTRTRASAVEQVSVATVATLIVCLPPIFVECFPLSTCSMFAKPYAERRFYTLENADSEQLNNDLYGLRTRVNWYLEYTFAVKFPKTVVPPPDVAPNVPEVVRHIQQVAKAHDEPFPLALTMDIYGDINGDTIGRVGGRRWSITEDNYRAL